uniref:Serine/threonine/tyrosine kinase 1a n=1 Tax=Cyclopterus lumpus TaxID=8103 RepID=A0A8C2YWK0_CYCLU
MSSNSTDDDACAKDDNLCIVLVHMQAVIIVPTLLLLGTLVTLLAVCIRRYCPEEKRTQVSALQRYHSSTHKHKQRNSQRHQLQGIDAPPGINPLEHEELPMSVQEVQQTVVPTLDSVPQVSTERQQGASFGQVTALPQSFSINPDKATSLYRARMNNRDVVLRVLKERANSGEKQHFLGFASFVSGLGPHPFLPELLGVVSVQPPPMMMVEELQHRDLLGYLWRCRQDNLGVESSCDMTEKRIFSMAEQVASALDYLHSQRCIHGNVGARSVLVGGDLTAKLWGLGSAYRRTTQAASPGEGEEKDMRKWQAPEVLSRRGISPSSDVWSFGILLYEMVTLGDPPFAKIIETELLQHLQRGKHLKRPTGCSNSLYAIIRACCHWRPEQRLPTSELIRTLHEEEKSANGRTVLRAEPMDIENYLREAGYAGAYNYTVL